jgi:predicted nucleotide-binding protein
MILQYFGFEGVEKQQAISEIISSLRPIHAQWGVYRKNIQEMHMLLKAVMESIDAHGYADLEVGRCVTASSALRTRARAVLQNPDGLIRRAGFRIVDPTSTFSEKVRSAVPTRFELGLTVKIRPMGKVESREVDASAVCDTVRQRQDNRCSDYLKAFAIFVSPNASLIYVSEQELRTSGLLLIGEISYVLTMAQLAGILWIAVGAGGAELPMKTLLANCVAALASNQVIIRRMREIVSSLGEEEAMEFEGIIENDRCAYYLTKLTIGGPVLLTRETGLQVFEELRRRVALDAEKIAAEKYTKALLEKEQEHALKIDELRAEFAQQREQQSQHSGPVSELSTRKVFVVHGHDEAAREAMGRFLERIELEAIILHEQPDKGLTVIEKFEEYASQVSFAVVLLTPDDLGGAASAPTHVARARQNVIFELGHFVGQLGRGRACLLRKGEVEIPSDLYGVIYIDMDAADGWKLKLVKELKAAGLEFDANKLWS